MEEPTKTFVHVDPQYYFHSGYSANYPLYRVKQDPDDPTDNAGNKEEYIGALTTGVYGSVVGYLHHDGAPTGLFLDGHAESRPGPWVIE